MSGAGAAAGTNGNYRIDVADFGPIRRASVDLRPLTVFAGPSNTGKSYLARLVYAMHKLHLGSADPPMWPQSEGWYWPAVGAAKSLLDREDFPQRFLDWWSVATEGEPAKLPEDLASTIRGAFRKVVAGRFEQELLRCFGVDALENLVCLGSSETTFVISLRTRGEQHRYSFRLDSAGVVISGRIGDQPRFTPGKSFGKYARGLADIKEVPVLLHLLLDGWAEPLIGPLNRRACYLPADRSTIMDNHQWLVSSLFQSATAVGTRRRTNGPLLIGVLADFVSGLTSMSQANPSRSHELSALLEKNLLKGAIRLHRSRAPYPSFTYRPYRWNTDLPLQQASSMVSELAPVVLYLRYLVEPNDVLIIEEPEAHLHPALQAAFARELARLVHSGVRVVLTTHSEWILEALANLVRLSELSADRREGIAGADVALDAEQVGAWLFKPDPDGGGSEVVEIPLDTDAGSFPAGFGEVTEALYNEWARISNRIEAAKAEQND